MVLLSREGHAVSEIAAALEGRAGLDAIHIVAHGAPGELRFASGPLNIKTINDHRAELAEIGNTLKSDGTILLWSCETGAGWQGACFVEVLERATGAEIAAAQGKIGAAVEGGKWNFGTERFIAAHPPLTTEAIQTYEGVMADVSSSSWDASITPTEQGVAQIIDSNVNMNSYTTGAGSPDSERQFRKCGRPAHGTENQGIGAGQIGISGSNVTFGGVTIGTLSGGTNGTALSVTLNGSATQAAVQALARALMFANTSDTPPSGARAINLTVDDLGSPDTVSGAVVTITAVNDAPVVAGLNGDSATFTEGGAAVALDQGGNATVTDADSANFSTGTLTVAITAGGTAAEDVLSVQNVGTADGQISVSGSTISYNPVGAGTIASIGTFTGGTGGSALVITLDSDATPVAVQALMRALQYSNSNNNNPSGTARTVTVTLTDGDGGTSNVSTTTVNVTGVNDAPVVANLNGDSVTFTEGGAAVALDQGGNATVADVELRQF